MSDTSYPCPECGIGCEVAAYSYRDEAECPACGVEFATNPVASPGSFGLTTVVSIDQAGAWEFDTLTILKHKTRGEFFWAADSGCSCPTPFEGFGLPDDHRKDRHIEPITDYAHLGRIVDAWVSDYRLEAGEITQAELLSFKSKVRAAGLR
jgi:hypothetical protein